MNYHNVRFIKSAGSGRDFPEFLNPHVVISGKSNVGKSSLINKLLNRKNFARTSSTPGKTATINFFDIDGKLILADLPGYGYAKVSKDLKKTWAPLVDSFLNECDKIALFLLLVDIRHAPTQQDKIMMDYVRGRDFPFAVIATKSDKLSNNQKINALELIKNDLGIGDEELIAFSAKNSEGKDEILDMLDSLA